MKQDSTNELVEMMFAVFRRMKDEMSFTNHLTHLSIVQIQTLFFINHRTKTSMSDIAEYFHIELPSATSLITKLCDVRLVERHANKDDRRLVLISLTYEGRTLLEQAMKERRKKLEKMLSYLSAAEKIKLFTIIKTLNAKLKK